MRSMKASGTASKQEVDEQVKKLLDIKAQLGMPKSGAGKKKK